MTNTLTTNTTQNNNPYLITSNPKPILTIPADSNNLVLEESAALEVKGKLIVNGKDVVERLTTIEEVLGIPERDEQLEKDYPKLKKMYEAYIKELSKCRMWQKLKT